MSQQQSFLEKCYKDRQGKVSLFQVPNLPLLTGLLSTLITKVISGGIVHDLFSVVGFGALFTWAWLELFSGSNYLRRTMGLVVLGVMIRNRI